MTSNAGSFDHAEQPPAHSREQSLPDGWEELRSQAIPPRHGSEPSSDLALREEFLGGARALGLIGRRKTLHPQQLLLADVLNRGERFTGVLMPRRSTKTTTILAWLIGRGLEREDYLMAYGHMASQKKARERFLKDVVPIVERIWPDAKTRPFKIVRANGQERLVFDTGSILQFLGPNGDDYRSDAYDVICLDEGGEAEPEVGEDVLAAALPTQDTRPGAMLIVAGTAATYRAGNLLWDELEEGRAGTKRHAILDYSEEDIDVAVLNEMTWEDVRPMVEARHPGVGNLTSIEAVEDNFSKMTDREKFAREYLGIFGMVGETRFLNRPAFDTGALDTAFTKPPKHWRIAFQANVTGTAASIVGVWRDDLKHAVVVVLESKAGTDWAIKELKALAKKFPTIPIVYDSGSASTMAVMESVLRARPKPKTEAQNWAQVSTAAVLATDEIDRGNVKHWAQQQLQDAISATKKRGSTEAKRWAFGSIDGTDISSVEAFSIGLRAYDEAKPARRINIVGS